MYFRSLSREFALQSSVSALKAVEMKGGLTHFSPKKTGIGLTDVELDATFEEVRGEVSILK